MNESGRIFHAHSPGIQLALGEEDLSVLDKGYLGKYGRNDLELRWMRPAPGTPGISTGKEKTVLVGSNGLLALNGYSGSVIWQEQKSFSAAALYHEKIFAADSDGFIYAYEGPANVRGPEITLKIREGGPTGADDWYTVNPALEINGSDRETYVSEIQMQHNDGPWGKAPASLRPGNGEHRIRVYGTDSRGLQGQEAEMRVKVDAEKPVSTLTLGPAEPESGWYNQPLTLSFDASDEISGVEEIRVNGGGYTGPLYLADQGIHKFSWYARDKAGNREIQQEREIRIDREAPFAEAELNYDQAVVQLEIRAADALSGIASIEYRINDGEAECYAEPLLFMESGDYMVQYRAVDAAGNSSPWQACEVRIRPEFAEGVLIGEAELDGSKRFVMTRARNGLPLLLARDSAAVNDTDVMNRLPSYVLGAEYILWEEDDIQRAEDARIRFKVNRDAAVYLFLPNNYTPPAGWSFVENIAGFNRFRYPGGAAVYMRRFNRASLVELHGTAKGVIQPLIVVQELGSISADLVITMVDAAADDTDGANPVFILDAVVRPWQHSRRLPLRRQWFVYGDEGWQPLEKGRYELGGDREQWPAHLRFRLEIRTPDGELEYRAEKAVEAPAEPSEEED
jgi:hypothetical protein